MTRVRTFLACALAGLSVTAIGTIVGFTLVGMSEIALGAIQSAPTPASPTDQALPSTGSWIVDLSLRFGPVVGFAAYLLYWMRTRDAQDRKDAKARDLIAREDAKERDRLFSVMLEKVSVRLDDLERRECPLGRSDGTVVVLLEKLADRVSDLERRPCPIGLQPSGPIRTG